VGEQVDQVTGESRALRNLRFVTLAAVLGVGLLVPLAFAPWREQVFAPVKIQVLQLLTGIGLLAVGTQLLTRDVRLSTARGPAGLRPTGVDVAAVAFGVVNVIAFAHSLDRAGSWWGRFPEYQGLVTVLAYLVAYGVARVAFFPARPDGRPAPLEALFGVLTVTTGLVGGYAVLQRLGLDPLWGFVERPSSTLGHANNLAAMLVVGLPGCAAVRAARRGPVRAAATLAGVLGLLGLVTSLSRGGWLAALAAGVVALVLSPRRARRRVLAGAAVLLIALLAALAVVPGGKGMLTQVGTRWEALLQTDNGSTGKHLALARVGVAVTLDHPWAGIGQESFPLVAQRYANERLPRPQARLLSSGFSESPHNTLLSVSAGTGVPGLLAYLCFVGAVARRMLVAHRFGHRQAAAVLTILVAYFVSSLFMTPEVSSTTWFWLTAGAACSAVQPADATADGEHRRRGRKRQDRVAAVE
jgi:O-antigen ligase